MSSPEPPAAEPKAAQMRQLYEQARRIAHSVLRGGRHRTWGTTILVNEAFVRLLGTEWSERMQAEPNTVVPLLRRVMQNALTDHLRRKGSNKRPSGHGRAQVYYEDGLAAFDDDPATFLDILEAMERLRRGELGTIQVSDVERFAEAVELGFILGCSAREISAQLDVPQTTVSRWLRYGKALINQAVGPTSDGAS